MLVYVILNIVHQHYDDDRIIINTEFNMLVLKFCFNLKLNFSKRINIVNKNSNVEVE